MKTPLLIICLGCFVLSAMLCACSKPANTNQATSSEETNMNIVVSEKEDSVQAFSEQIASVIIETDGEAETEPAISASKADKSTATTHTTTSSSSLAYSSYEEEEKESDYWEERGKHSPNDNYLMGFDEDVDDVHDMEIYMEDY